MSIPNIPVSSPDSCRTRTYFTDSNDSETLEVHTTSPSMSEETSVEEEVDAEYKFGPLEIQDCKEDEISTHSRGRRSSAFYPPLPPKALETVSLEERFVQHTSRCRSYTIDEVYLHPYLSTRALFKHLVDYLPWANPPTPEATALVRQIRAMNLLVNEECQTLYSAVRRCMNLQCLQKIFRLENEKEIVVLVFQLLNEIKPPCHFFHPWLTERSKIEILRSRTEETIYHRYFDKIIELLDHNAGLSPLEASIRVFNPIVLHQLFGQLLQRDNGERLKTLIQEFSQEETSPIDVTTIKR